MSRKTILYLLRHGATEANLAHPARLQGQKSDPPLAPLGVRQAQITREFLAARPLDACFTSPLLRARQTACIIAEPHGIEPASVDALMECDIGRWEGLDWGTIRQREPEAYLAFWADPASFGYPGGESFADVHARVAPAIEEIIQQQEGKRALVVAHHVVHRTYLAGLLGLAPSQAKQVTLDNCGISVVVRDGTQTSVATLNAVFHLQGLAA